jgi:hypothetical protein
MSTIEAQRAARRAAMPVTTALMEQYAEFKPKLIYAQEGAHTFGKLPQYAEVFDVPAGYFPCFEIPTKGKK